MDYNQFPSLIKSSDELVLGLEYFHVYGGNSIWTPRKEIVIREPYRDGLGSLIFEYETRDYVCERHCYDCGLDGANYNMNRMFTNEADAKAYAEVCEEIKLHRTVNDKYTKD